MEKRNDLPSEETTEESEIFSQFFGTAREVVAKYTHCALCGAYLHFTHITDFSKKPDSRDSSLP